jgi:hypothetical protein
VTVIVRFIWVFMNTNTDFPVSPRADVTPESSDRTAGVLARRGDEGDVITSAGLAIERKRPVNLGRQSAAVVR